MTESMTKIDTLVEKFRDARAEFERTEDLHQAAKLAEKRAGEELARAMWELAERDEDGHLISTPVIVHDGIVYRIHTDDEGRKHVTTDRVTLSIG
jgi:hypothetical protein